jgi:predicted HicB family RNase H-like nuclease
MLAAISAVLSRAIGLLFSIGPLWRIWVVGAFASGGNPLTDTSQFPITVSRHRAMINSMDYKGYTASMVFDTEDKIIVGRVLDIDDIISFHGESVAEFEFNFHAAIEDYLAASQELGSAPEKPASGKLMLRISPEIHAAALKAAARSGTSLNKWAKQALGKAARKPSTRAVSFQRHPTPRQSRSATASKVSPT